MPVQRTCVAHQRDDGNLQAHRQQRHVRIPADLCDGPHREKEAHDGGGLQARHLADYEEEHVRAAHPLHHGVQGAATDEAQCRVRHLEAGEELAVGDLRCGGRRRVARRPWLAKASASSTFKRSSSHQGASRREDLAETRGLCVEESDNRLDEGEEAAEDLREGRILGLPAKYGAREHLPPSPARGGAGAAPELKNACSPGPCEVGLELLNALVRRDRNLGILRNAGDRLHAEGQAGGPGHRLDDAAGRETLWAPLLQAGGSARGSSKHIAEAFTRCVRIEVRPSPRPRNAERGVPWPIGTSSRAHLRARLYASMWTFAGFMVPAVACDCQARASSNPPVQRPLRATCDSMKPTMVS